MNFLEPKNKRAALNVQKLIALAVLLFVMATQANAQYSSYKLTASGDTVNALSKSGLKEGKWIIHVDELRGEQGYEEEGVFVKGIKEGVWRRYTLQGDLLAIENYKRGGKDGAQQYFTFLGELMREESWKGYDPDSPYDTIAVYGAGSNEIIEFKIVKAEQYSVKQGEWKYYDPSTGNLVRSEEWERNVLKKPTKANVAVVDPSIKKAPEKTPEMLEWEKKNRGKKNAIRDGRTGL